MNERRSIEPQCNCNLLKINILTDHVARSLHSPSPENSIETGGFQHLRCRYLHLKRLSVTLGRWVIYIFTPCSASEGRIARLGVQESQTGIPGHCLIGERRAK